MPKSTQKMVNKHFLRKKTQKYFKIFVPQMPKMTNFLLLTFLLPNSYL